MTTRAALLLATLTAGLAAATPAPGAARVATGISDPMAGVATNQEAHWFQQSAAAKASYVRLNINWVDIATRRPNHPSDPADPAYDFGETDRLVREALAAHLIPVLTLHNAPRWAEHNPPRNLPAQQQGTWKPDPAQFGAFVRAIATRYSGKYPNLCGLPLHPACLPRVGYYEIWNEPNLSTFLSPQWTKVGKGRHRHFEPLSPTMYAGLLNSAYDAIKAAAPAAKVLGGVTAPKGSTKPGGSRIPPVTFLESFFCLNHAKGCAPTPKLDVVSAHPIDRKTSPTTNAPRAVDVFIPNLDRITKLVHAAQRQGHVKGPASIPLWVTEFWWETNPPDKRLGIAPAKQAKWISKALHLFAKQNVAVAFNFLIRDERYPDFVDGRDKSYQSGLYYHNDKAKPAARALKFPFDATRTGTRKVSVWGQSPRAGAVTIERRVRGRWHTVKTVVPGSGGAFAARVRARGSAPLRARAERAVSVRSEARP
jgi:hypothetical protein